MDNMFDLARVRSVPGMGGPLAANSPGPLQSFDQMPSPIERDPGEEAPQVDVPQVAPPPPVARVVPASTAEPVTDLSATKELDQKSPIDDLLLTKDDLQNAADAKRKDLGLGMFLEGIGNRQSFGNFQTGHLAPHNDFMSYAKQMASLEDQPIEKKKILLAQQLKQPEMELAMRSADPTSTESTLMGNMMKANIQNNQQMTPDQKDGMLKIIDGKSAAELNKLAGSPLFADMMANDKLYQTLNNKIEVANMKAEMMRQLAMDRGSKVSGKDQMKTLKETQNAMEQMRGDPSTQQAEKDIYAADKADTLMNMYGDPNKLSKPQVQLIVGEIGKIAQGGSPTIHELEGLNPNTFQGNVATAWGKLVNDPQPANLASFVKQYQDYANGVTKDAENHVLDRYSRIIDPRRDYLSDADQQRLDAKYTHRFDDARKKRADKADAANPKMSDEDAAAFQHIKDQPNDPNAGAIASVLKKKYPSLVK